MGLDMFFYMGDKISTKDIVDYNKATRENGEWFDDFVKEDLNKDLPSNELYKIYEEKKEENFKKLNLYKIGKAIDEAEDIKYFRKHPDLHGFIADSLGYMTEYDDNCTYYLIEEDTLHKIKVLAQKVLNDEDIEEYSGFFWGESTQEDWEETLELVNNLLEEVDFDKKSIYYSAWY